MIVRVDTANSGRKVGVEETIFAPKKNVFDDFITEQNATFMLRYLNPWRKK